ncbi:MAG: trypco2 family protein [Pseudomonadota bacterium]
MKPIEIPEAVAELRTQIARAQSERPEEGLVFEIEDVELQIQGTLTRSVEAGANGKVKFQVLGWGVEAGANAAAMTESAAAHSVKIKLKVKSADGTAVDVSKDAEGVF